MIILRQLSDNEFIVRINDKKYKLSSHQPNLKP